MTVQRVQCVRQKFHADNRGPLPLMLLEDDGVSLAVIDDLTEAVTGVGQFDRGELIEVSLRCGRRHNMSPGWSSPCISA